jgi:hypothetical protein
MYEQATGAPHRTLECFLMEAQKKFARKIEKLEFSARLPASAAVGLREAAITTKVHPQVSWRPGEAKQQRHIQLLATPRRKHYHSHERQATARRGRLRWRCETGALQQWLTCASSNRRGAQEGRGHGEDCCYEGQDGCWKTKWIICDTRPGISTTTGSATIGSSCCSTTNQRIGRCSREEGCDPEEARGGKGKDRCCQGRCIGFASYGRNGGASADTAGSRKRDGSSPGRAERRGAEEGS